MTAWLLLIGAILAEVTATLSLRGALDHPVLYAIVAIGYLLSFSLLVQVLRRGMGLGVAYGIWGASGVVLTAVLSAALFGEPLTPLKAAGIALVAAGVVVVELGSQRAQAGGSGSQHALAPEAVRSEPGAPAEESS